MAGGTRGASLVVQGLRLQGPWVASLVGELRSCMLHGAAKEREGD